MKSNNTKTIYATDSITYWPSYKYGRAFIAFIVILWGAFFALSLLVLFDNTTMDTRVFIIMLMISISVVSWMLFRLALKSMYVKVVVNDTEVVYNNFYSGEEWIIKWEKVNFVYFKEENWYGRKMCIITYENSGCEDIFEKKCCDFILPVCLVDENKLLQFIPKELWKNTPWS